jgi:hypothetical protein
LCRYKSMKARSKIVVNSIRANPISHILDNVCTSSPFLYRCHLF